MSLLCVNIRLVKQTSYRRPDLKTVMSCERIHVDDLVVIAEDENELTVKLNQWESCSERNSLKVNTSKTKMMASRGKTKVVVTPGNIHVAYVAKVFA